ncbi:hypothetical protein F4821DRAFT_246736 [Hypoxylon rubiginosum]|uniref:Uncharacterized protein n=1 Tax=Hypoxylon rubiginosum TaxID=110542 RepID=A0ACC0CQK3_9PEZI|nr:hypothetical protein F4821DRAFT_246736 [Hypoxylon rubiginosum]
MEPDEISPMPAHLAGPAQAIPVRTSSKRALEDLSTAQLDDKRSELSGLIKKRRSYLKPRASHDAEFWQSSIQVLEMEKQLHEYNSIIKYRQQSDVGDSITSVTYNEWLQSVGMGLESARKQKALELKISAAESQASLLAKQSPTKESWIKLFFGAPSGFGISNAAPGKRDSTAQSRMRTEMLEKYHDEEKRMEMPGHIWDPVCGSWFFSNSMHAAHLYPWKSVEHMDAIFGEGAKAEIMTAVNGMFLFDKIEEALDRGYLAIVPDVRLEPDNELDPETDRLVRREYVKSWEKSDPKEYKIIVLDNNPTLSKSLAPIFASPLTKVQSLEDLHGRRLEFQTDHRPRSRYMWWLYLNSVVNLSYRRQAEEAKGKGQRRGKDTEEDAGKDATNVAVGIDREVELGNRFWGTRGRYVRRNLLLGFVEHIGHDISSIKGSSSSILENAIEEEAGQDIAPDASLVAVLADSTIRKTSANLKKDRLEPNPESDTENDGSENDEDDEN